MVDFLSLVTYHRRGGVRDGERTQRRRSGIVLVHLAARGRGRDGYLHCHRVCCMEGCFDRWRSSVFVRV
jgi:hypothetical protein